MSNPIEVWKSEKHPFDVWFDVEQHAAAKTPMKSIAAPDLERMKWHGIYYRKRDTPASYMMRVRLTGCELSHQQAKEMAYIAYEHAYGIIDITTRANIQIQGLAIENTPEALARIEKSTHCPLKGDTEYFDLVVDGERIANQALHRDCGPRFFTVDYEVPTELTQGKEKVTVRFEAHQGNTAGGLFGLRVLHAEP